jgi:hypothetical protein
MPRGLVSFGPGVAFKFSCDKKNPKHACSEEKLMNDVEE